MIINATQKERLLKILLNRYKGWMIHHRVPFEITGFRWSSDCVVVEGKMFRDTELFRLNCRCSYGEFKQDVYRYFRVRVV